MFTLPIDKVLKSRNQLLGKTSYIPTWELTVTFQPGRFENKVWTPCVDSTRIAESNLVLEVLLGDQCISKQPVTERHISVSSNQVDSITPTRQNLIIRLDGAGDFVDQDLLLLVDIYINSVSILNVLTAQGKYINYSTQETSQGSIFMHDRGEQILEIYNPIYVWLLQHQQLITQFSQKP